MRRRECRHGPWRVRALEVGPPGELLRGGLELLDGLAADGTPTLRWYRSTTTAVVLGRGQRAPARTSGTEFVGRFSGGGAVLLTPDMLSLDLAVPAGHPLLRGNLAAAFLAVGHAWAAGLGDLGVEGLAVHQGPSPARRGGSPRERLLAAVCYATLGRGEVSAHGRKLVGLAQRRRRHGALVQCGLLRRWCPGPLLEALGADPDDAEIARAAVGLDELGGHAPGDDEVMRAVSARVVEEDACDG